MSEITVDGLAERVATEIPKFFRDGIDQVVMGEGEYIRAGEPQGQIGKIGQAVARSYCRRYGEDPSAARFGNAERIENACRPYLDDLNPGDGPEIEQDVIGGQCAGTFYNVSYLTESKSSDAGNCGEFGNPITRTSLIGGSPVLGPIGQITEKLIPRAAPSTNGDQSFEVQTGSGLRFINLGGATSRRYNLECGNSYRYSDFVAVRSSGDPDTCGNPPPVITQPRPRPDDTGPNFRFNPSPDIDIQVDVEVSPSGDIIFDIGGGPVTVDPFPPEGGGGGDSDPPGDVGESDETGADDADGNGSASGCAGVNQVLGGLKVSIVETPPGARVLSPGIFRGACYIYMGTEGNLDQDFGGSMLRDGQFFLPQKENLTCWEVQANLGFRLRVTPYYKTLEDNG